MCRIDLRETKEAQEVKSWYHNEWAIVGITAIAMYAGYVIGVQENRSMLRIEF